MVYPFTGMNEQAIQCRRALIDDLPTLRQVWADQALPAADLERRITQFQLAFNAEGELLGGWAIQVTAPHGIIHSAFYRTDEEETPLLKAALLERTLNVVKNHGLYKLWVQSSDAFWLEQKFLDPTPEDFKKPPVFPDEKAKTLVLRLKEETLEKISIEQEFKLFSESEHAGVDGLLRQARIFKIIAYVILFLFIGVVAWLGFKLWRGYPLLKR